MSRYVEAVIAEIEAAKTEGLPVATSVFFGAVRPRDFRRELSADTRRHSSQ